MKRLFIISILFLFLFGCASITPQITQLDQEFHKTILEIANSRLQCVSCDLGLIDGLGIACSADFPIMSGNEARAILQNPAISLALGEMKEIAKLQGAWSEEDYNKCKLVGLGYRTTALVTIDILKLFPQLAPYLAIFGK